MSTGARAMCIVWHVHCTCKMVRPLSVFKPAKFDAMQTALPLKRRHRECSLAHEETPAPVLRLSLEGQPGDVPSRLRRRPARVLRSESFSSTDTASLASPPGDPHFETPDFNTPETVNTPVSVPRSTRPPRQIGNSEFRDSTRCTTRMARIRCTTRMAGFDWF